MSLRLRDALMRELETLRYEPIDKRIRGLLGGDTVIDSTRALLVWEPKRVVPTYGFPVDDVAAELVAVTPDSEIDAESAGVLPMGAPPQFAGRPVPRPERALRGPHDRGRAADDPRRRRDARGGGVPPADETLAGHVIVEFEAFDAWFEEDEPNVGHPRDPFHRIDVVRSTRHVRVEHDGELIAESHDPYLLFEPPLPVRYYMRPRDVRTDLLRASETRSVAPTRGTLRTSRWRRRRTSRGRIRSRCATPPR